jgi:hypothetical protein
MPIESIKASAQPGPIGWKAPTRYQDWAGFPWRGAHCRFALRDVYYRGRVPTDSHVSSLLIPAADCRTGHRQSTGGGSHVLEQCPLKSSASTTRLLTTRTAGTATHSAGRAPSMIRRPSSRVAASDTRATRCNLRGSRGALLLRPRAGRLGLAGWQFDGRLPPCRGRRRGLSSVASA